MYFFFFFINFDMIFESDRIPRCDDNINEFSYYILLFIRIIFENEKRWFYFLYKHNYFEIQD